MLSSSSPLASQTSNMQRKYTRRSAAQIRQHSKHTQPCSMPAGKQAATIKTYTAMQRGSRQASKLPTPKYTCKSSYVAAFLKFLAAFALKTGLPAAHKRPCLADALSGSNTVSKYAAPLEQNCQSHWARHSWQVERSQHRHGSTLGCSHIQTDPGRLRP